MPSASQIKRQQAADAATNAANAANAATNAADAGDAADAADAGDAGASFDLDSLLGKLDGASWAPAATSSVSAGSLIDWPEDLAARAKAAGFSLWPTMPARATIGGMGNGRHLATAPVDLSRLSLPPMSERIKANGEAARDLTAMRFLTQLATGTIITDAGIIAIPSLAKGQDLPVALVVAAYGTLPASLKTGKKSDYLSKLFDDRKASVMGRLADIVGRYIYLNVKTFELVATDTLR